MRKIEVAMLAAMNERRNWRQSNTRVEVTDDEVRVTLFGNLIARLTSQALYVTAAGWNTPTTRSRLNAILSNRFFPHGLKGVFSKNYTLHGMFEYDVNQIEELDASQWYEQHP